MTDYQPQQAVRPSRRTTAGLLWEIIRFAAPRQIVERGTHRALLTQDGLYASMWARQSKGFETDRGEAALELDARQGA